MTDRPPLRSVGSPEPAQQAYHWNLLGKLFEILLWAALAVALLAAFVGLFLAARYLIGLVG